MQGDFGGGFGGDGAAYFPTLTPDEEGNVVMNFTFSGNGRDPSPATTARRVTLAPGIFHDGGQFFEGGGSTTPIANRRWGDYSAGSFSGLLSDTIWIAGENSDCGGSTT